MKRNRVLSLLLAVLLIFSSAPVYSGAEAVQQIAVGSTSGYRGNTVYVNVDAVNFDSLGTLEAQLYYDSAVLTYLGCSYGSLMSDAMYSFNTATTGELHLTAMWMSGVSGSGRLLQLQFRIASDAPFGASGVSIAVGDCYGADLAPTAVSGTPGSVTVNETPVSYNTFYINNTCNNTYLYQGDETQLTVYNYYQYAFATGVFTVTYDKDLLSLVSFTPAAALLTENAVYSVNDAVPGQITFSYANLTDISAYNLFTVRFAAAANEDVSTSVSVQAENVYTAAHTPFYDGSTSRSLQLVKKAVAPDYPDLYFESEKAKEGQTFASVLKIEEGTGLAAANITVRFDPAVFRFVSIRSLLSGVTVNNNKDYADGVITFTYLNMAGLAEAADLIELTLEVIGVPNRHYTLSVETKDPVDAATPVAGRVLLDHIGGTGCVYRNTDCTATCTAAGVLTFVCPVCGDTFTEDTPALGHDWETDFTEDTPSTCTGSGQKSRHCTRCSELTDVTVTDPLGHDYSVFVETVEPTCTEGGYTAYRCARCGDTCTEPIEALGHDWETEFTVDTAPTCVKAGSKSIHCSRCDAQTDVTATEPLGHGFTVNLNTVEPTCTEGGYTVYRCSRCTATEDRDFTDALGHDWATDFTVDTAPTCTGSGQKSRHCTRCSEVTDVTEIAPQGHEYVNHPAQEPTCTEPGWNAYETCSRCDYSTYEELPVLGHDYVNHAAQEPTCTEIGWNAYVTCSRCDYSTYAQLPALGHDYTEHSAKKPTCTAVGWEAYVTCSRCDYTTYEALPALGHSYTVFLETVEPTCTEGGYSVYRCSRCTAKENRDSTDPLGHDYASVILAPTCTEGGYTEYTCNLCGDTYTDDETEALGHDYAAVVTEPTCTEWGYSTITCSRCGDTFTAEETEPLGHEYTEDVTEPTCTEGGYTTHTCSRCGDTYTDEETEPLGHVYGAPVWIWTESHTASAAFTCARCDRTESIAAEVTISETNATCTQSGETKYAAAVIFNNVRYTDTLTVTGKPLGHNYVAEVTEPTCTEGGYTTFTCSRCGDTYTDEETDPLGHDYTADVTEPTCTEGGYTVYTCSRCGDTYTGDETEALGHDYVAVVTEPTCMEDGYTTYTCSRCGDTYTDDITEALGHDYAAEVTDPTCTEGGYTVYTCTRCGDTYTDDITEALGHSYTVKLREIDPTCTLGGYTLYRCERCFETQTRDETPALGHRYISAVTQEPTCTASGVRTFTCERCEDSYTEAIPAAGHSYGAPEWEWTDENRAFAIFTCAVCGDAQRLPAALTITETDATCTEAGTTRYLASVTFEGAVYTTEKTVTDSPLGHSFVNYVSNEDATCTEDGTKTAKCERCEVTDTVPDEGSALGHSFTNYVSNGDAACTADGTKTAVCGRCGAKDTVTDEGSALGHSYGAPQWSWTEDNRASAAFACGRCEHVLTVPATVSIKSTDASCTVPGTTVYNAEVTLDGVVYTDRKTVAGAPLGHDYVASVWHWAEDHSACIVTLSCARCGDSVSRTAEVGTAETPATCTEGGTVVYTAMLTEGDKTFTDSVTVTGEPLGHRFVNYVADGNATCTLDGTKTAKCERCEVTDTLPDEGSALGHSFTDYEYNQDASCTLDGTKTAVCSRCNATDTVKAEGTALGHDFGEWTQTAAPTCTEKGVACRECARCGAFETKELEALGHELVNHAAQAPTCTEAGWAAYVTCSRCDYTTYAETVALGHELINHAAQAPTCTEAGWAAYVTCSRCDYTTYAETAALGHELVNHAAQAPTCTEAGWAAYVTCTRCDYTTYAETAALGHAFTVLKSDKESHWYACANGCAAVSGKEKHRFGAWTVAAPATVTQPGSEERACVVCGFTETRETPKTLPNVLFGDVDQDGKVTTADARLVLRRAIDLENYGPDTVQYLVSDVDFNGNVTPADARLILRAAIGLESPEEWLAQYIAMHS